MEQVLFLVDNNLEKGREAREMEAGKKKTDVGVEGVRVSTVEDWTVSGVGDFGISVGIV